MHRSYAQDRSVIGASKQLTPSQRGRPGAAKLACTAQRRAARPSAAARANSGAVRSAARGAAGLVVSSAAVVSVRRRSSAMVVVWSSATQPWPASRNANATRTARFIAAGA
ncbi:unnamed protein product, partial [Prorocentrum cordatum]